MKTLLIFSVFSLLTLALGAEMIPNAGFKEAVAQHQREVKEAKTSQEKADALVNLSVALWQDQEFEQAVINFLSALELPIAHHKKITDEELLLYNEALKAYLGHNTGGEMKETAQELLTVYLPIVEKHPDYTTLNFMVATAYANLGKYDQFFRRFYISFQDHPDSYMSYRTQAVLHIKLYERGRTEATREHERSRIASLLAKAVQLNGEDPSLYRMMIAFAPVSEKGRVTRNALETILKKNIVIPRQDILFYVQHAVDAGERLLAQRFVEKARGWYQYSRVINRAEELIGK